jgi:hypothetical protein
VNADGGKYVQQAEFKLKSISTALRLKKPDDHIEEIRHYSSELQVIFLCLKKLGIVSHNTFIYYFSQA